VISYEQVAEQESLELLHQLEDLRECALLFAETVESQQSAVEDVVINVDQAESRIVTANETLAEAAQVKKRGTSLKGSIGGLVGGAGAGGVVGLCLGGGVAVIPGIVIGGLGGTALGFGSSKALTGYIDGKIDRIVRFNSRLMRNRGKLPGARFFGRDHPRGDGGDRDYTDAEVSMAQKNLLLGLKALHDTRDLACQGYQMLLSQGEALQRVVQTVESIQQELETSGVLIARLNTNAIAYFVKLCFTSTDRKRHIDQLIERINARSRTEEGNLSFLDKLVPSLLKQEATAPQPRIGKRHHLLPFWSWKDVRVDEDFLLLQHLQQRYRVVAINPSDQATVIKLYEFTSSGQEQATESFEKIKTVFLGIFHQMDTRDIYQILSHLPDLNVLISEQSPTDHILDEMLVVLTQEVCPRFRAIDEELKRQNAAIDVMDEEILVVDRKMKGVRF
jgi:hypothetical protein